MKRPQFRQGGLRFGRCKEHLAFNALRRQFPPILGLAFIAGLAGNDSCYGFFIPLA